MNQLSCRWLLWIFEEPRTKWPQTCEFLGWNLQMVRALCRLLLNPPWGPFAELMWVPDNSGRQNCIKCHFSQLFQASTQYNIPQSYLHGWLAFCLFPLPWQRILQEQGNKWLKTKRRKWSHTCRENGMIVPWITGMDWLSTHPQPRMDRESCPEFFVMAAFQQHISEESHCAVSSSLGNVERA